VFWSFWLRIAAWRLLSCLNSLVVFSHLLHIHGWIVPSHYAAVVSFHILSSLFPNYCTFRRYRPLKVTVLLVLYSCPFGLMNVCVWGVDGCIYTLSCLENGELLASCLATLSPAKGFRFPLSGRLGRPQGRPDILEVTKSIILSGNVTTIPLFSTPLT